MSLQDSQNSDNAGPLFGDAPVRVDTIPNNSRWIGRGACASAVVRVTKLINPVRVEIQTEPNGAKRTILRTSLLSNYRLDSGAQPRQEPPSPKASATPAEIGRLRRVIAEHRGAGSVTTIEISLTPALAEALLLNNPTNRHPSQETIATLARDMTAGFWRLSHQGIGLGPSLELGDGQHRCLAVVKSGVTVKVVVAVYHDPKEFADARKTWDVGRKRSKANALELFGLVAIGQGKRVASILESVTHIDKRFPYHPTNEEAAEMYKTLKTSVDAVLQLSPKEFLAPTAAAFLIAHLKAPTAVDECIRLVTSKVGYAEGSAAHTIVLRWPELQKAKGQSDRMQLMRDTLSMLYKHVKKQPGGTYVKNNETAYKFFLGENVREGAGR